MKRRAIVTGGTRGIGKAIAMALHADGYHVAAIYAGNDEAARKLESETGIKTFKINVADYQQCADGIAKIESMWGDNTEIVVNCAGITRDAMLHKLSFEHWQEVILTNLGSVFNTSRAVITKMREKKFGRIVSMSSVNANGMMGQTNYSASKAGIEGFTKALALESARAGITVNAIAPGYINTEMVAAVPKEALDGIIAKVPVQRLGNAEEIARTVRFLVDDDAGFITGVVVPVNGGLRV